jgi:hypothetical protein
MTPVHRTLQGDVLAFDLAHEMRTVRDELAAGHERIARTLVKEGPLRLTLIGLNPGGAPLVSARPSLSRWWSAALLHLVRGFRRPQRP